MLIEVMGAFSVGWVWFHLLLIFVFGRVWIGESVRWIITLELLGSTIIFVFWIVRIVKLFRRGG